MMVGKVALIVVFLTVVVLTSADEHSGTYVTGEDMIVWANKVGPYANSFETYRYYFLPYCRGTDLVQHHHENLGEALQGYELVNAGYGLQFAVPIASREICKTTLTTETATAFSKAIKEHYWYQLFTDNLPVWGMVGELKDDGQGTERAYIFTHKAFSISRNGNQVIEVNMTSDNAVLVEAGAELTFSLSVTWSETTTLYVDRWEKFLDFSFFEHQIHWFSIFNSFMMVIFLVGIVAMILLKTLRRDYEKARKDAEGVDFNDLDDSGWKHIHGDVFRAPPNLIVLSSLLGAGFQLAILAAAVIGIAATATLWSRRGSLLTVTIVAYAVTSIAGGYYGGAVYKQYKGVHWIQTMLLTALLYPTISFTIAFLLNFIAMSYHSLAAISFGTMVVMVLILVLVSCPLSLLGNLIGRQLNGELNPPCRVVAFPRHIPEKRWYMRPIFYIPLGGVLPFGSIFIELYFVFTSFWHYKFYYVYGFLLLVFTILVIVSVCVTIVSTYFLLNVEDYRWHWSSFLSSASTAVYVYLYCVYYFVVKTAMTGFFQTAFYFGYMLMFCIGIALMCGTIGFIGASVFVHRIYYNLHVD